MGIRWGVIFSLLFKALCVIALVVFFPIMVGVGLNKAGVPVIVKLIVMIGVIVPIPFGLFYLYINSIKKAWEKFAQEAGLSLIPKGLMEIPRIEGNYRGFPLSLYEFKKGSSRNKHQFTIITLKLPATANCNLHIYLEHIFITKEIKARDIELGDMEFDKVFMVESDIPEKMHHILTPELRQNLLNFAKKTYYIIDITIADSEIKYTKEGILSDTSALKEISEIMWNIAKNVTEINEI